MPCEGIIYVVWNAPFLSVSCSLFAERTLNHFGTLYFHEMISSESDENVFRLFTLSLVLSIRDCSL